MLSKQNVSGFALGLAVSVLVLVSALTGALADRLFVFKPLNALTSRTTQLLQSGDTNQSTYQPITDMEGNIISVSANAKKSVVTVSVKKSVREPQQLFLSPFGPFFGAPGEESQIQRDIGTGFVVSQEDGLVVTNKHVVDDAQAEYILYDSEGNEHKVERIYRDPANDLAILQTDARLPAIPLSDSGEIQVGQSVIAIGTALGEFRHTVTTGVVSGLGRGIEAGSGFAIERLDNLIQTDAAINPGNSGGPLLNTRGEVIGVNVAVAAAENIGFAIPINTVRESLTNFNDTGKFDRPLLGVRYKVIPRETALLNDVPEGAYVIEIIPDSTASKADIRVADIITKIDGQPVKDTEAGLAGFLTKKKIGDTVTMEVWRDKQTITINATLQGAGS